jgi:hypothetical protein
MHWSVRVGVVLVTAAVAACSDLRDYRGAWQGHRIGDSPALRVGLPEAVDATLTISGIDHHGMRARLTVPGVIGDAGVESLAGAEADALSGMTFPGDPLRVYLSFVATTDGGGDVLAVIALYDDDRVELRVLRGGAQPVYGVFALDRP